jgi:hypothetical protein
MVLLTWREFDHVGIAFDRRVVPIGFDSRGQQLQHHAANQPSRLGAPEETLQENRVESGFSVHRHPDKARLAPRQVDMSQIDDDEQLDRDVRTRSTSVSVARLGAAASLRRPAGHLVASAMSSSETLH